jgi:hypothetical protein
MHIFVTARQSGFSVGLGSLRERAGAAVSESAAVLPCTLAAGGLREGGSWLCHGVIGTRLCVSSGLSMSWRGAGWSRAHHSAERFKVGRVTPCAPLGVPGRDGGQRTTRPTRALTPAVTVAALTIYDMCKAVHKAMVIGDVRLVKKTKQVPPTAHRSARGNQ